MIAVLNYILIAIVTLLVLILLTPIHFNFMGEYARELKFQGRIGWAGELLNLEMIRSEGGFELVLGLLGLKKTISAGESKHPDSRKPPQAKVRNNSTVNIWSFLNRQLFAALKDVLGKMKRALHLELGLSGVYGFDDPSLTGALTGIIAALNRGGSSLDLNPDFTAEVVDIRGSIKGWFVPVQILGIGVMFLLMKPVRSIWWSKIKFSKKQKEAVQYA